MGCAAVALILSTLAQGVASGAEESPKRSEEFAGSAKRSEEFAGSAKRSEEFAASAKKNEEAYANRWLVLGKTHDTRKAAEAQAAEIREHHYPSVCVIETNHFENMSPGRFAVVFWALSERNEALRRSQGIWNLGHRSWIRWSGKWTPNPTKASLRERRKRLSRQRRAEADAPDADADRRRGSDGADASSPRNAR